MPWQDGDALGGFYREASLAVVPSRYETFGLVALEALSLDGLLSHLAEVDW